TPFKGWADQIHGFHFLGVVLASLVLLMAIWGQVTPLAEPWQQQDSGDVDLTPWKPAKIYGLILVLIVLSLYIKFADLSAIGIKWP
ncbi:MAG: solute:sodium symporter family transporter, partial [Planctomycetaceae bacterium]|nr:solute:sodium symporter family transporter [Planctomycetaceae bacterium]